jgi:hypothetical protein
MYLLLFTVIYLLIAIPMTEWTKWKKYYTTIQYYVICDLLYNFLFYDHTLWEYRSVETEWLNHTIIDLIFTFLIIPVAIYFYLSFLPEGKKMYVYITGWVILFEIIEFFFHQKGLFLYHNGWNAMWSFLFNIVLFTMLRLHYRSNVKAIILTVPVIALLLWFFHPSFADLK